MNVTLLKALIALLPACMLFCGSALLFLGARGVSSFLQLLGTGFLMVVVFTHLCEALNLFPSMHWGLEHSAGHYLDLGSAIVAVICFPAGYLFSALAQRRT